MYIYAHIYVYVYVYIHTYEYTCIIWRVRATLSEALGLPLEEHGAGDIGPELEHLYYHNYQ